MKARWLSNENAFLDVASGNPFSVPMPRMWPVDKPIPEGWEEVEFVTDSPFRGTLLVETGPRDSCQCGQERSDHTSFRGKCLNPNCECLRFREAE